jgi:putative nucleotidyltransferase with HDIG domain
MDSHVHKINRDLIVGWLFIVGVLFISYSGEVLKGERSVAYLTVFMLITGIPPLICTLLYRKHPELRKLRYYIVVGYFFMYLFSMITGSTSMVFSYILPMLSLLVLYHQPNLILYTGIASMIVNLFSIFLKFQTGEMTLQNSKDGEIQIALLFLCFAGSYAATRLYDEITKQNISYLKILDEKNNQIQKMTLQTIATIANTIDAKDEYTRGHSKRVSEYSAAIAQELGFSEKEVKDIRSVALLHDIGKIGVPDAVLNKPGKLTDEEYRLMKQHTIVGSEILKDIKMVPGIDIGARYHHERYDGKGYPEGLVGEAIPISAQIVSVADVYDALVNERVYKDAIPKDRAYRMIVYGECGTFSPNLMECFNNCREEMEKVQ